MEDRVRQAIRQSYDHSRLQLTDQEPQNITTIIGSIVGNNNNIGSNHSVARKVDLIDQLDKEHRPNEIQMLVARLACRTSHKQDEIWKVLKMRFRVPKSFYFEQHHPAARQFLIDWLSELEYGLD